MQKFLTKKIIILSICALASCARHNLDPYILSHISEIQALERQDHQLCLSLKLNTDKIDNLQSTFYWRCRLSFAKYRLSPETGTPQRDKRNMDISDLVGKISLKLAAVSESFMSRENKKIDNRQHKQCLVMGYKLDSEDQAKIDEYFSCRKALIEEQQLIPPYGETAYLQYPNYDYNLGFVVDRRIEESIKRYNSLKEKYPTCVKFNLYSENFKLCTAAQDKSRQCFAAIERRKFKREWEEKTACQKQAYLHFDDKMIKQKDGAQQEIERSNANADFYNERSFSAVGLDGALFSSTEKTLEKTAAEKRKEREERAKKINSKDELYTKFELTKLRQKYISACSQKALKGIDEYVNDLIKSCEGMVRFEIIGDE